MKNNFFCYTKFLGSQDELLTLTLLGCHEIRFIVETKPMYENNNVLLNIRRLMPTLNPAFRKIGAYILENPDRTKFHKINEIAKRCEVSESTVTRFVKATNFSSFHDFKIALAEMSSYDNENATNKESFLYDDITKQDTTEDVIGKVLFRNTEALKETAKLILPSEIEKAASAIDKANNLVFYCIGNSTIAAEHAKMRFYTVGKQCIIYNDPVQQAVSASLFNKDNVAIGISLSGSTITTVNSLKLAKGNGATTISITNSNPSPILQYSDIKLFVSSEVSPLFYEQMVARMCQLLVIDILFACFAKRHFSKSLESLEKAVKDYRKSMNLAFRRL